VSARIRDRLSLLNHAALVLIGCVLAAALRAATPGLHIQELDKIQVTSRVAWPLSDCLEYPRFDSVVISPDGTHLATGWSRDSFLRRIPGNAHI
jgi:hypothetical protein